MTRKIVVNSPFRSTWAARDVHALRTTDYEIVSTSAFADGIIRGVFTSLWFLIRYRKAIWIHQSAGHASFIPCLMSWLPGVKNIIIAIGTESACFPEIDYGLFRKWSTRVTTKVSLQRADLICPVHESMELYDYTYWDVQHKKQGIKAFLPDLKTPFFPIHNGYDPKDWGVDKLRSERKIDVLCVFAIGAQNRSILKGADLILGIARRCEKLKFRIIGTTPEGLILPVNCEVVSNCTQADLRNHYNDSKIFIQPSITEGFPNTLCEAMACGCLPIGSNVSSIPDIILDYGFLLEKRDEFLLESLIHKALENLDHPNYAEATISTSIFIRFSAQKRRSKLLEAIKVVDDQRKV